jgi:hypothetical protein
MITNAHLDYTGQLDARVVRRGGDGGPLIMLSKRRISGREIERRLRAPLSWWRRVWIRLRREGAIPVTMGFAAFLAHFVGGDQAVMSALVTTAGINLLAADFITGAGTHISAFNYHDCGTGAVAAAIGDVALGNPFGGARVAGTQSTPVAGQYRSVATINFAGAFAITEWGLFSAAAGPTLWDRRVFAAINVANGDSIQFTYTLTCNAGGS